ncbi:MAG: acetyl-CoA hydrolase/transferase family protein [Alphaproteobacteria bacterium]|nr:acetyl-CoA hydrolase/transferase family protein [Alphaproteobacteria bacterium]
MAITLDADRLDLATILRPGDLVLLDQVGAEPTSLAQALVDQAATLPNVRVFLDYTISETPERAAATPLGFVSLGAYGNNRHLADKGRLRIIPAHFSEPIQLIERGLLRPDVVFLQATPADGEGRHSLGVTVHHLPAAMAHARIVVAEINDRAPWTFGDGVVDGRRFDYVVPVSRPLLEWRAPPAGPLEDAIAGHVARLVPDRATLQYGVGAIPDAIARRLGGRRDLGVHSGSLADSFVDLVEAGAVTNRYKEIDPGVSVATALYGTKRLYDFAHRNPALKLMGTDYTHGMGVLGQFGSLVAINSAIQADLTGQVGAEAVAGRSIGAVGGQAEYQRAAVRTKRGRGIITLASSTRGRSNIVARLDGPVTTPRSDADAVVTEYGVAELRGRTLEERAAAMIAIAHPDHRAALAKAVDRLC